MSESTAVCAVGQNEFQPPGPRSLLGGAPKGWPGRRLKAPVGPTLAPFRVHVGNRRLQDLRGISLPEFQGLSHLAVGQNRWDPILGVGDGR